MEIQSYLKILVKRWRWLALVLLVCVGSAALYSAQQTRQYRSTLTLFISGQGSTDVGGAIAGGQLSEQRVSSYADLVGTRRVKDPVLDAVGSLGLPGTPIIRARQRAETTLMDVSVVDISAVRAQAVAKAVGEIFPGIVDEIESPRAAAQSPITVSVIEPASLPTTPFVPRTRVNITLSVLLGLLVGTAFAFIADLLDQSVKNEEDLSTVLEGAGVIGHISFDSEAASSRLVSVSNPRSRVAEQYRQLRTNVSFLGVDDPVRSLVVTSSVPSEGKSRMACNLAVTFADGGQRVCIVDADLRSPSLEDYLGVESAVGLTSVLLGLTGLDDAIQSWQGGRLDVLATGPLPPNPSEVLGSQGMLEVIAGLEARYDVVVFDTPPLLPVTDAAILAASVSGVILVVRSGKTSRDQLRRSRQLLTTVGARLLGPSLNFAQDRGGDNYAENYAYFRGQPEEISVTRDVITPAKPRRRSTDRRAAATAVDELPAVPVRAPSAMTRIAAAPELAPLPPPPPAKPRVGSRGLREIDPNVSERAFRTVQAQRSRWMRRAAAEKLAPGEFAPGWGDLAPQPDDGS